MDSQSPQTAASSKEIDAVLKEIAALHAALSWARTVRLLVFLALLVLAGVVSFGAYRKVKEVTNPKKLDAYGAAVTNHLEENKAKYMSHVEILVDRIRPPLMDAFSKQATKDMPRFIKAVEKEREPFLTELQQGFEEKLNKRYDKLQENYEKVLKKEFPLVTDQKHHARIMKNFEIAMQSMLKKYYVDDLKKELDILKDTWDTFPAAKAPAKGEPDVEDQLISAMIQLASYRLMHSQPGKAR